MTRPINRFTSGHDGSGDDVVGIKRNRTSAGERKSERNEMRKKNKRKSNVIRGTSRRRRKGEKSSRGNGLDAKADHVL